MVPALHIAGIQAEFPAELEVTLLLDDTLKKYPRANMFLMSEYTFDGPVSERVKIGAGNITNSSLSAAKSHFRMATS